MLITSDAAHVSLSSLLRFILVVVVSIVLRKICVLSFKIQNHTFFAVFVIEGIFDCFSMLDYQAPLPLWIFVLYIFLFSLSKEKNTPSLSSVKIHVIFTVIWATYGRASNQDFFFFKPNSKQWHREEVTVVFLVSATHRSCSVRSATPPQWVGVLQDMEASFY